MIDKQPHQIKQSSKPNCKTDDVKGFKPLVCHEISGW
jgi:hypothetical protein